MERGRSPLVNIQPFGREFSRHRYEHQGYPSAWLRPRRARFRFAQQDQCDSSTPIGLNFRMCPVILEQSRSLPTRRFTRPFGQACADDRQATGRTERPCPTRPEGLQRLKRCCRRADGRFGWQSESKQRAECVAGRRQKLTVMT